MSFVGVVNLRGHLRAQRAIVQEIVPSYARVLDVMDADFERVEARVAPSWSGRRFDAWYERPLLLLAALRYEALLDGPDHPLHPAIAAPGADADAVSEAAVAAALSPERERLSRVLEQRSVQTNETTRAVAWMWVAHLVEAAQPGGTCALVDLGSSAGLNLVADALPSLWLDQTGRGVPTQPLPSIILRLGLDLRPLNALEPDSQTWLRACVWPGDAPRIQRLDAAVAALSEADRRGRGVRLEAMSLERAPSRLATIEDGARVLAVQTIVRDYLPELVKERYLSGMQDWLRTQPPGRAIFVELENTGDVDDTQRMASLTVHLRPRRGAVRSLELARTHPHPRTLFVASDAVAELKELLAGTSSGTAQ